MRIKNRSGKREFQPQAGAGFRAFERSGCENREEVVAGNGITIFYLLNFIILGGIGITWQKEERDGGITCKKGRDSGSESPIVDPHATLTVRSKDQLIKRG